MLRLGTTARRSLRRCRADELRAIGRLGRDGRLGRRIEPALQTRHDSTESEADFAPAQGVASAAPSGSELDFFVRDLITTKQAADAAGTMRYHDEKSAIVVTRTSRTRPCRILTAEAVAAT